jgi:E3 ubiquitin-protein ligase BIG BROTHER-like protein
MNDGRQMGVHYMDGGGFPYAVNEDFFQGINHVPVNYAFPGSMPDQVFLSSCNFLFF